tara:strand:- start:9425 stop:10165 length:741 start_codon:yes stop_codon:yes gene_type:complete
MDFFKNLEIAIEAALKAFQIIDIEKTKQNKVESTSSRDVKIFADKKSEKVIIKFLESTTSFSILSEEIGFIDKKSKYVWIIDPVDGSVNFSRGIPLSSVSIGLWKNNEPILGVIYDINNKDLYKGIVGLGAWKNQNKINVSNIENNSSAIICTGFPIATDFSENSIHDFVSKVKDFKKVRLLGSASLSLAYLASSCVDAYFEKDIKIWDVAAGIPIVLAAGGYVDFYESKKNQLVVKASSSKGIIL